MSDEHHWNHVIMTIGVHWALQLIRFGKKICFCFKHAIDNYVVVVVFLALRHLLFYISNLIFFFCWLNLIRVLIALSNLPVPFHFKINFLHILNIEKNTMNYGGGRGWLIWMSRIVSGFVWFFLLFFLSRKHLWLDATDTQITNLSQ
jgi:hypothetical protein